MAINIKFDLVGNPEPPTIVLANRNGNKLGQLKINEKSIELVDKFNDASEISFTINKYIDDELTPLWDKIVDFKLVHCVEWDCWFEIKVELDEGTETVKTVYCTQLGQAELSQIMLYNVEINTEDDIARDDYKISILWDKNDKKSSILDRMLEKAPHYSIKYVDPTIRNIQRSFSFNGDSIYDAFQKIAEEIGCIFMFPSNSDDNGKINRAIYVYDLQQTCNKCGYRGEFTDKCPKCDSVNITRGYGEDTLIFVTSDELASDGIQLKTDVDSVKNCFKLSAGDDLMTATIRNCNPNGSDYLWYFSDDAKEDMSDELVEKIESYDELYREYYNKKIYLDEKSLNKFNELVEKYKDYYNAKSSICFDCDFIGDFEDSCPSCNSDNIMVENRLTPINNPINGYAELMNAYYNTIDFSVYLQSALMPSVNMSKTTAQEQVELLTTSSLSPVAVTDISIASETTIKGAVLAMAKTIVKSTYEVNVDKSEVYNSGNKKYWKGSFIITNYSDENDTAVSNIVSVEVNDDLETFIKQKLNKALNKENTDDFSISGLFDKEYNDFCDELKKYALNPLDSFYKACQECISILMADGLGNNSTWSDNESGSDGNLYEKLYVPYYNKLMAIEAEMKVREDEIGYITSGTYDTNGNLIGGLQLNIEKNKNEIQEALNFEKYLGNELWLEFCSYRREDEYSNDNYISDGLNNAELFKRALEFIDVAENEIYKSAELQHSISTTLNNLLAIKKFKPLVEYFNTGNWIRVQVDDRIYKLRLLEYDINYNDFNNIPVEFSDVTKIKNEITDVESILSQASSMATSYGSVKRQADKGNKAKSTINDWISNGLKTALVNITDNNNERFLMDNNGMLCFEEDDITGKKTPEQLRITHNILAYTDDNWSTVRQAIGKHDYIIYDKTKNNFVDKTGYGMSADFVSAGVVSGSQIIGGDIYSDNYSNVNNAGSYLNLRDGTFSFGGGSLRFEGGKLLISSPNVLTENQITEINENYLKTTTVYAENLQVGSANIVGQLTATQINTTGLIAENISGTTITGKTISGGSIKGASISGGSININNKFKVDSKGNVTIPSGTISIGDVSGSSDLITKITKDTITTSYVNALNITAGSVAAENITGTSISGKTINGGSINIGNGNFVVDSNGNMTAKSGSFSGSLNSVSGTFTTLTAGDSIFSETYIQINAGSNNGYIYIGDPVSIGWEDISIYPSEHFVGNIGNNKRAFDVIAGQQILNMSERSMKENIQVYNIEQAYDELKTMPIYTYNYIDDKHNIKKLKLGTIIDYVPSEVMANVLDGDRAFDVTNLLYWDIAATQKMQIKLEDTIDEHNGLIERLSALEEKLMEMAGAT